MGGKRRSFNYFDVRNVAAGQFFDQALGGFNVRGNIKFGDGVCVKAG
jgi:hypothetical protein